MAEGFRTDTPAAARRRRRGASRAAAIVLCAAASACGQKGPPLAPLQRVPVAVAELSVRRVEDRARLRFVVPDRNVEGPGPVALDRVEIFAVTLPPGAGAPADRELLARENLVGEVRVRPAPVEGEAPAAGDARPAPGEAATFEEELTPARLTPVERPAAPADPKPVPVEPKAEAVTPKPEAVEKAAADPVRLYVARGVTRGGRGGPLSSRVELPIVSLPSSPEDVTTEILETGVRLGWTAPSGNAGLAYNVYAADEPQRPLNVSPLEEPGFEHGGVEFGREYCYQVRSVRLAGEVPVEGHPSTAACVTPRDVFPPAAPQGLAAVPTPGQISLIWDANTERDLAGYLVLRGEEDGPLTALTPAPIKESSYRDTTVTPGVRYVYAVVAVDTAEPSNTSPQSARIEETAR